jgi:hypothetical protein
MKRLLLIAILVGTTVVAAGWWYHRRQLLAQRWAEVDGAAAVEAALAERIDTADFAGDERPWGEVLDVLKSHCDVPLGVHAAEAAAMGIDRQTRVNVPEGVFPLDELLDEITGPMDLSWRRAGDRIEVTSYDIADKARNKLITRVYPLPAGTAAGGKLTEDADAMYDLITTCIEPNSWDDVGGDGIIKPAGGALVIRQTAAIHRQIAALFARMAELPDGPPRHFRVVDISAADAAAERALSKEASIDAHERSLETVIDNLASQANVPIRWGDLPLPERLAATHKISYRADNQPLGTVLTALLAQTDLRFRVERGGIVITIPDDPPMETWFYEVGDLVAVESGSDFDSLIDLLTTTIEPDSWDEVGGSGTLQELGDEWLVVAQVPETHKKLQRLLPRLRAVLTPGMDPAGDKLADAPFDISPAVLEALDREVALKYVDQPLDDVCADLTTRLNVPVILRGGVALVHSGMGATMERRDLRILPESRVTIDLPPLPVRQALGLLLESRGLEYDVDREVIQVAFPEDLRRQLPTSAIDVRHLLGSASGGLDEDTIVNLVTTCVEPDMWDEVGGPGSVETFRGLLVYRQTYDGSRQVQELIDALSEHCLPQPLWDATTITSIGPQAAWGGLTKAEGELLNKLSKRDEVHLKKIRWDKALHDIANRHGIPLVVARRWIEEEWGGGGSPPWDGQAAWDVSLDLQDATVEHVLRAIASEAKGSLCVTRGVVLVTSPDEADTQTLGRLYPLRLPKRDDVPQRADQVADMLAERLEPDAWRTNGGYGAIEPVGDEWLLVVQTLPMHRRVEETLKKLEHGKIPPLPMP